MLMVLAVTLLSVATAQSSNSVRGKYRVDVKQVDIHFRTRHFLQQEYYVALKLH
jgi:polyisoprenoid-binding protein YceI